MNIKKINLITVFLLCLLIGCSKEDSGDIEDESTEDIQDSTIINNEFDLSEDPGINELFLTDLELSQTEDYVYRETASGDHNLLDGIISVSYDLDGADDYILYY